MTEISIVWGPQLTSEQHHLQVRLLFLPSRILSNLIEKCLPCDSDIAAVCDMGQVIQLATQLIGKQNLKGIKSWSGHSWSLKEQYYSPLDF